MLSLDGIRRLYSESKGNRIYEQIRRVLLSCICVDAKGELSLYGKYNFVALSSFDDEDIVGLIKKCNLEINEILQKNGGLNVADIHFGYFCTSSMDVTFKTALERTKQACNMAIDKNALFCRWDNLNGKEFERKIKIENNIENEIDNNRFFLEYQPIIDAATGRIIGAEVLSRLNSSTEGILTPYHFLAAVNSVGLNEKFDYCIFEKNCKWIASDKEKRMNYVYTVNFSRQTLCDPLLAQNIISIIEKYKIDFSCIAVEILEDKELNKNEKSFMMNNLKILKEKGVLILLDDFGKGYTGFGDLTELDISIVKIDKSITQNGVTENGFLILKNIIKTAHDLGFKALCEGIETEHNRQIAIDAGCDMLQGYYFHRPMPVTRLEKLFE